MIHISIAFEIEALDIMMDDTKLSKDLLKILKKENGDTISRKSLIKTLLNKSRYEKCPKKDLKKSVKKILMELREKEEIQFEGDETKDDTIITLSSASSSTPSSSSSSSSSSSLCLSSSSSSSSKRKTNETIDDNMTIDNSNKKPKKEAELTKEGKEAKTYPEPEPIPLKDQVTILLFYAYCSKPMSDKAVNAAIDFCRTSLEKNGCTGRLRIAREGYNATLTGSADGIRGFTTSLSTLDYDTFGDNRTDFKYVDGLPPNQRLKGLKVWFVNEIVTYGFDTRKAPLDKRGTHLSPTDFHKALEDPNAVVIDVRNFNETLIGKFVPPGDDALKVGTSDGSQKVLDPCMRRSTEFPKWVDDNRHKLDGKKVLMYCTGGVRCERASAFMRNKGIQNVFQLEGGIHRYLEAFKDDGGHWKGKNYTFDRRFSHGADKCDVISRCVVPNCKKPWDRYQAKEKCRSCAMEVLVCRDCQRGKIYKKPDLLCPLC